jgi:hypothetical protein
MMIQFKSFLVCVEVIANFVQGTDKLDIDSITVEKETMLLTARLDLTRMFLRLQVN